jgi:hypothetical protein
VILSLVNRNLVGRCGLYCGACGIYRAFKDGGEYRLRLADVFKCPPDKVRCEGCQVLTTQCWGNDCKIVRCLNAKGLQFCYEFLDYERRTCEEFEKFSKEYLKDDDVDLRANLMRIKVGDFDEWLKETKEKYRCSYCGEPLPTRSFKKKCYHCGKQI